MGTLGERERVPIARSDKEKSLTNLRDPVFDSLQDAADWFVPALGPAVDPFDAL
jgi:hypothetical protein